MSDDNPSKDYKTIFDLSHRDLRILHGYLLAQLTDSKGKRSQELVTVASRARGIEQAIRTLEMIEDGADTTIHTDLEDEYLSLSGARFNTVEALENTDNTDEDELDGPGVY